MKKANRFMPSTEGILIRNEELETLLSQAICPGWTWSLYAGPGESGSNDPYIARLEHPVNRETYDIEFSRQDPSGSFLENVRDLYNDYRDTYETLGVSLDSRDDIAALCNALCWTAGVCYYPDPVGYITSDEDGTPCIKRGESSCGMIFKDWETFHENPGAPCYMPVLSDRTYTGDDFFDLAGGNQEIAVLIFQTCNGIFPETILDDLTRAGITDYCRSCGKLYLRDEKFTPCPECGEYPYDEFMEKISEDIQFIRGILSELDKAGALFNMRIRIRFRKFRPSSGRFISWNHMLKLMEVLIRKCCMNFPNSVTKGKMRMKL